MQKDIDDLLKQFADTINHNRATTHRIASNTETATLITSDTDLQAIMVSLAEVALSLNVVLSSASTSHVVDVNGHQLNTTIYCSYCIRDNVIARYEYNDILIGYVCTFGILVKL